ncbi:MAG: 50S ribosomal protein L6 [Alphaproteobacteria bacterium CG_4_10_14_0_8_um_filter_37_21]|nr:MAG: 50S ribosomal protein L6 [Alphaproteobacteria bacterium CG_4_10_14_0_8_um_filter_37_21]
MSRVGKNEIKVPSSVALTITDQKVTMKGSLGERSYDVPGLLKIEKTDGGLKVSPVLDSKKARELWGTANRTLTAISTGVDKGFTVNMELKGVGYKAQVQGNKILLQLAYSHEVQYELPHGVTAKCEKPTALSVTGPCAQVVGQIAAEIRKYRKPEPYKGKGIIRDGEFVLRKEGKKK